MNIYLAIGLFVSGFCAAGMYYTKTFTSWKDIETILVFCLIVLLVIPLWPVAIFFLIKKYQNLGTL